MNDKYKANTNTNEKDSQINGIGTEGNNAKISCQIIAADE